MYRRKRRSRDNSVHKRRCRALRRRNRNYERDGREIFQKRKANRQAFREDRPYRAQRLFLPYACRNRRNSVRTSERLCRNIAFDNSCRVGYGEKCEANDILRLRHCLSRRIVRKNHIRARRSTVRCGDCKRNRRRAFHRRKLSLRVYHSKRRNGGHAHCAFRMQGARCKNACDNQRERKYGDF